MFGVVFRTKQDSLHPKFCPWNTFWQLTIDTFATSAKRHDTNLLQVPSYIMQIPSEENSKPTSQTPFISEISIYMYKKCESSCRNNNKIFNSLESSCWALSSTINSFPEALNRIFCPVRSAMHFNIWVRHPTSDKNQSFLDAAIDHAEHSNDTPVVVIETIKDQEPSHPTNSIHIFQKLWMNQSKRLFCICGKLRLSRIRSCPSSIFGAGTYSMMPHCDPRDVRRQLWAFHFTGMDSRGKFMWISTHNAIWSLYIYIYLIHCIFQNIYIIRIISATHVCKAPKKQIKNTSKQKSLHFDPVQAAFDDLWHSLASFRRAKQSVAAVDAHLKTAICGILHWKKDGKIHQKWVGGKGNIQLLLIFLVFMDIFERSCTHTHWIGLGWSFWRVEQFLIDAPPGDPNIFISTCQSLDFWHLAG